MFPGLDLYYTDPVQHIITAGLSLRYLDRDLSDLFDACVPEQSMLRNPCEHFRGEGARTMSSAKIPIPMEQVLLVTTL